MTNNEIKDMIVNKVINKKQLAYRCVKLLKTDPKSLELQYLLRNGIKNQTRIISLDKVLYDLSKEKLIRNSEGKISAYLSMEELPDYLYNVVYILAYANRDDFAPLINKLIPLWMMAHKIHNGILYEDWSKAKEDKPELSHTKEFWEGYAEISPNLKQWRAVAYSVRNYILENGKNLDKKNATPSFGMANKALKHKVKGSLGNKLTMNILGGVGLAWCINEEIENKADYRILNLANFDMLGEWKEVLSIDEIVSSSKLW